MKLDLTSDEYRLLLDAIYIADWVMHAHDEDEREDTADHRELFQKIFAHAKEAGCEDLIVYDDEEEEYFETGQFEEESPAMELIEEYDEDNFWDELTTRLAWRDAASQVGEARLRSMGDQERMVLIGGFEEAWNTELEENGLERLDVVEEDI